MATHMSPFLCVILLTFSGFLCLRAHEGRETPESHHLPHHHIVQVSALMPSTTCNDSNKGPKRKASLQVVHKYGPCFQSNLDQAQIPNYTEIFLQDQFRVYSIQLIFSKNSNNSEVRDSKATILPAYSAQSLGSDNYIVTVGLGMPKQDVRLAFDTGSSLTWTQCEPCSVCYEQADPIFDPAKSTSYSNIPCNPTMCSPEGEQLKCSTNCLYHTSYGDLSESRGDFSKETLTLTSTDVLDNFSFGCGHDNTGTFRGIAGLLGLGRHPSSIIKQAEQKYSQFFSYCLPSMSSSTGHLTLGNDGKVPNTVKYTRLLTLDVEKTFYGLELAGIVVNGRQLSVPPSVFSSPGTIIDSGTAITRLPQTAYNALRTAFREALNGVPMTPGTSMFDTCYDFSNKNTVSVPSISFLFGGGVDVKVDPAGVLEWESQSQACLAFAANKGPGDVAIIGNFQQQKLEVVYDVAGEKIGFGPGTCN